MYNSQVIMLLVSILLEICFSFHLGLCLVIFCYHFVYRNNLLVQVKASFFFFSSLYMPRIFDVINSTNTLKFPVIFHPLRYIKMTISCCTTKNTKVCVQWHTMMFLYRPDCFIYQFSSGLYVSLLSNFKANKNLLY